MVKNSSSKTLVVENGNPIKLGLLYHRTNKLFAVKCNGNYKRHKENRAIMTRAIEVVYENNVFKPLGPVEGIEEHERMVAIFSRRPVKKGLQNLAGTITHDEARAMQKCIDEEFEKIEGCW